MSRVLQNLVMAAVILVCLALIIIGQKHISVSGLTMELVGLVGLLVMLFWYNRRFR